MNCPMCGGAAAERFADKHDLTYLRCTGCDLVYSDVTDFDYVGHNEGTSQSQFERHRRKFTARRFTAKYQQLLKSFEPHRATGNLLEIGCSSGAFLAHARDAGWSATGVEPAAEAASYGISEHGLDIRVCTLEEAALPADHFDCAYSNAVLEHLPDPGSVVRETFRVLRPGGVMYADTVNLASYTWENLGTDWRLVDPRAHLCLFTPATLTDLCRRCGFEVVKLSSHGVRFRTREGPRLGPFGRMMEELRKAPYSFAARHNLKGDSIAVLARKPEPPRAA